MNKKFIIKGRVAYFLIISITLITFTGCANNKREDVVSSVIKQIYQAPDSELITLSEKMFDDIEKSGKDNTDASLENSDFFTNLAKRYEDYVTSECYEKLISQQIPYKYHLSMAELGYNMEVLSIDIDKNNKSPNIYDFTINISFGLAGNVDKDIKIKGSAQFENKGNRINFLRLLDEDLQNEIEQLKTS